MRYIAAFFAWLLRPLIPASVPAGSRPDPMLSQLQYVGRPRTLRSEAPRFAQNVYDLAQVTRFPNIIIYESSWEYMANPAWRAYVLQLLSYASEVYEAEFITDSHLDDEIMFTCYVRRYRDVRTAALDDPIQPTATGADR